jgi:hypothetical protein
VLFCDASLKEVTGTAAFLSEPALTNFEHRTTDAALPNRWDGQALASKLRQWAICR